jgi:hypothetical protein
MLRVSSRALIAFATAALAISGCRCNPAPVAARKGEITIVYEVEGVSMSNSTTGTYDFGQVPMGKKVTSKMVIKNTGGGSLFLDKLEKTSGDAVKIGEGGDPTPVFIVAFDGRELTAGSVAEFDLSFDSPIEEMKASVPHESQLILRATNTEVGKETAEIILKGNSVSGECELPATLDFGAVSRGDQFPLSIKIKNTRPIDALSFIGDITSNSGDDKAFTFTPDSPKGEVSLKANQEKTVTINFAPTEVKDYLARVTMRRLDGCPDRVVKLIGTGVDSVLTWAPNPLDMGYVTPGLQVSGEVTFSNLGLKEVSLSGLKTDKADYKVVTPEPVLVPGVT